MGPDNGKTSRRKSSAAHSPAENHERSLPPHPMKLAQVFDKDYSRPKLSPRRLLPTSKLKIAMGDIVAFGRPLFNFQQLLGRFHGMV